MISPIWFFVIVIKLILVIVYWDKVSKFIDYVYYEVLGTIWDIIQIPWVNILLILVMIGLMLYVSCGFTYGQSFNPKNPDYDPSFDPADVKWVLLICATLIFGIIIFIRRQNKKGRKIYDESDIY